MSDSVGINVLNTGAAAVQNAGLHDLRQWRRVLRNGSRPRQLHGFFPAADEIVTVFVVDTANCKA